MYELEKVVKKSICLEKNSNYFKCKTPQYIYFKCHGSFIKVDYILGHNDKYNAFCVQKLNRPHSLIFCNVTKVNSKNKNI